MLYSITNSQKIGSCSNEKITNDDINCYFRRHWERNEGAVEFLYCQTVQQSQAQGRSIGKIGLLEQAGIVTTTMSWFVGILPCIAMSKKLLH